MENEIHNPLTGTYREVDDEEFEKGGAKWPALTAHIDEEGEDEDEEFERQVPIFPVEKSGDERIVAGIVYSPDETDAQGDTASAEEIEKACYHFMEKAQQFKVMHKGKPAKVKILENYIAPQNLTIGQREVKKGSWVLVCRINDSKIWKAIKAGKLTGFSMAGYAKVG
ncbi:hypothetical protein KAU11_12765 [Candidatus Babeliales bacterium]|nr:hypothetical protein [Candidatus Babeliales bacterium]